MDAREDTGFFEKILTDTRLSAVKSALEKDHAITCLLLLHYGLGRWGPAREFIKSQKRTISDGTFRSRMIEFEMIGLSKSVQLDPLKRYYVKTEFGDRVAVALLNLLRDVDKRIKELPLQEQ